jgi:hypothetical protein
MPSLVKTRLVSGRDFFSSRVRLFDAESGEDQISYRAVTSFLRESGFSMPSLVKTRLVSGRDFFSSRVRLFDAESGEDQTRIGP